MARDFEALIVDFGGVLTTPMQESMAAFCTEVGIEVQDFVRVALAAYSGGEDPLIARYEKGEITELEFSTALAQRLSEVSPDPISHEGLVPRIFGGLKLEYEMLGMIKHVRDGGVKTALLSNSWGSDLYPKEALDGLFDVSVISGEVGLRKPDPAIFELAATRLGVPLSGCIFVDDHPGHLDAAEALGMTTILHLTPEQTIERVGDLLGPSVTLT